MSLPTSSEIFTLIKSISSINTEEQLAAVKVETFKIVETLHSEIDKYIEKYNTFSFDPDILLSTYQNLHQLNSGLIGLLNGLKDKAFSIYYLSASLNGAKVPQGDKKIIAEGKIADLEALSKSAEELQRSLYERMYNLRRR